MESLEDLRRRLATAARQHLGDQLGMRWTSMLAEGTRLVAIEPPSRRGFGFGRRGAVAPVGRLGGPAPLPRDAAWPTWDGRGPMAHVATLDCRHLRPHLPTTLQDAGFPQDGLLSFFYFDGQVDGAAELVGALFGTNDGARVVYTPPATDVVLTESPAPLRPYASVELRAEPVLTWPTWEHPELYDDEPADGWDDLLEVLDGVRQSTSGPLHQVGGHPDPLQGQVEAEIAYGLLSDGGRNGISQTDPVVAEQSQEWVLLAQFDTDDQARFMWGDAGVLYFMIRRDDLAAGAFDRVGFTWQC